MGRNVSNARSSPGAERQHPHRWFGQDRTVTILPAPDQTGTATITLTVSDGSATTSRTFDVEITPAVLIVNTLDASRLYGDANPTFNGDIQGLQIGDNITLGFSTAATTASPVGSYPINATLLDPNGKLSNTSSLPMRAL